VYSGFHNAPASAAGRSGAPSRGVMIAQRRSVALGRRTGGSADPPMLHNRLLPPSWGNWGYTAAFRKVVLSESNVSRAGDGANGSAYYCAGHWAVRPRLF
jgi:hypothetical protein